MLAHFQPISKNEARNKLNSKREKLMFSFRMYDLDGDGEISKVRYQKLLKLGKFSVFQAELLAVLTMMVEGIDQKELDKIAEKLITV